MCSIICLLCLMWLFQNVLGKSLVSSVLKLKQNGQKSTHIAVIFPPFSNFTHFSFLHCHKCFFFLGQPFCNHILSILHSGRKSMPQTDSFASTQLVLSMFLGPCGTWGLLKYVISISMLKLPMNCLIKSSNNLHT